MSGLTDAERRGARVLVVLLALGTLTDLVRARFPDWAPPPAAESVVQPATTAAPNSVATAPMVRRVNLDTATAAELDALPGIGPVLAARIVEHRAHHGRFHAVEELLAVPGIGPRLLERLRPHLEPPAP